MLIVEGKKFNIGIGNPVDLWTSCRSNAEADAVKNEIEFLIKEYNVGRAVIVKYGMRSMGAISDLIENLRTQCNVLEREKYDMDMEINKQVADISYLNGEIRRLKKEIDDKNVEIEKLEKELQAIKGV